MTKRTLLFILLLAGVLTLNGCMTSPPETLLRVGTEGQTLISATTEELAADSRDATLYFRYGDSGYLAPELRSIPVRRNESMEKALVEALVAGPASSTQVLTALFPPGTEVLATSSQGSTLFVTFSEAFLGRYADEPENLSGAWRTEGPLRRQLCLDALTATLTEAGVCTQVQILVYKNTNTGTSMRLQAGFLSRSADDTLLPPLTRDETVLLTPYNTAGLILQAWLSQDWNGLYDLCAREGSAFRPMEQTAFDAFSEGNALTAYTLYPGTVSFDGQTAVLTVDFTVQGTGQDVAYSGYPLRLSREAGLWKIDYSRLTDMMNGTE